MVKQMAAVINFCDIDGTDQESLYGGIIYSKYFKLYYNKWKYGTTGDFHSSSPTWLSLNTNHS